MTTHLKHSEVTYYNDTNAFTLAENVIAKLTHPDVDCYDITGYEVSNYLAPLEMLLSDNSELKHYAVSVNALELFEYYLQIGVVSLFPLKDLLPTFHEGVNISIPSILGHRNNTSFTSIGISQYHNDNEYHIEAINLLARAEGKITDENSMEYHIDDAVEIFPNFSIILNENHYELQIERDYEDELEHNYYDNHPGYDIPVIKSVTDSLILALNLIIYREETLCSTGFKVVPMSRPSVERPFEIQTTNNYTLITLNPEFFDKQKYAA